LASRSKRASLSGSRANAAGRTLRLSRRNAEQPIDEFDLADNVAFGKLPHLTFSDHLHRVVSLNRVQRSVDGSEPQARGDSLHNKSMVLFQDVVEVG
jgi:hypothetical protein